MLKDKPIIFQLFTLVFLFLFSLLVVQTISFFIAIPLFNINLFTTPEIIYSFDKEGVINLNRFIQVLTFIFAFILFSLLFTKAISDNTFEFLKLNKIPNIVSIIIVSLIIISYSPLVDWLGIINSKMHFPKYLIWVEKWMRDMEISNGNISRALLSGNTIYYLMLNLFIIAVLPAIGEELLFRGILQNRMIKITDNVHWGIFITGFIFSAFHFQFFGFIPRLLLGVVFGYIFYWSNSLILPMIAHFLNNGIAVVVVYFYGTENSFIDIQNNNVDISYVQVILSAISVFVLLFLLYNNEKDGMRSLKEKFS